MKANISLEMGVGTKSYYAVINDKFYIKISKALFFELAEFLNVEVNKNERL